MAVGISSGGGTGSSAIETSYIQLYNDGFQQQFQQMDTRFAKYFDVVSQDSEFQYYERMGVGDELVSDNVRYADNPVSEISVDRRQIGLDDYHQGKYVEMKDLIRLASDPTNAYVTALTAAAHRKMDKIVLDAIFGTAKTGKSGGTSVSFVGTNSDKITVVTEGIDFCRCFSSDYMAVDADALVTMSDEVINSVAIPKVNRHCC